MVGSAAIKQGRLANRKHTYFFFWPKYLHINHDFFNRPIDHQSTSNDRLKSVLTTGLVNMHIDRSIANLDNEPKNNE